MFDNLEDGDEPWHVCRTGWCADWLDHMSCSLISTQTPSLFAYGVGFIVAANVPFECGYTGDGGTQGAPTGTMGGCRDRMPCTTSHWWAPSCQWPASSLRDALATQIRVGGSYNEYVISKTVWEARLPGTIEAVVCRDDCGRAKEVHLAFLARYALSADEVPLVYYDGAGAGFAEIRDHLPTM